MLLAGQRQAFFKLFAAQLPELEDAAPMLNRVLAENRDALLEQLASAAAAGHARGAGPDGLPTLPDGAGHAAATRPVGGRPGGQGRARSRRQSAREVHRPGHQGSRDARSRATRSGLRHNFKASTALSLEEANNPEITAKKGNSGSVMDYLPANIAPQG